jgi:type VI secretion system protein VasG
MSVALGDWVKKLGKVPRDALEQAIPLCQSRTNYHIEIEHWLLKLVEPSDTDVARILRHFEISSSNLQRDLTRTIDHFKRGNSRLPTLSLQIEQLLREAWALTSVQYHEATIRSGVLLLALLSDETLGRLAREASPELAKVSVERLSANLPTIVAGSPEDETSTAKSIPDLGVTGPSSGSRTAALDQFTVNLTERARVGQIDPVLGRDAEIRQLIDILIRRRQNNPILTGEAGVGKTAVVEGFARRIANGDVPPALQNVHVRTLDLGLLQAGAGLKGEFENRLKQVISEVKNSPIPVILFIDEAHTLIGAGGEAGQGDAANLLKPALARGDLRTIAATTWAEYKKYFEKDAALARRFQVVKVDEPSEARAIDMMRGVVAMLEQHHHVRVLDEAVEASVKLAARYITGRQLPDKSLSLLDTACARVAIGQSAVPPAVEDARRQIEMIDVEMGILNRENATGAKHHERLTKAAAQLSEAKARLAELEGQWAQEGTLVAEIHQLRDQIEARYAEEMRNDPGTGASCADGSNISDLRTKLDARNLGLRALQGDNPLTRVCVDAQTVADVVSGWTGIPVGKIVADEVQALLRLKSKLEERVVGQSAAIEVLARRIWTSRASLSDPCRPTGVFLLVGPSGVGKTETALALADALYGGERNLVVINMSEYKEEHTVSSLKGAPPGYVGYGEGGVLTEAVRRKPYSVVLLDEVEKAHRGVMELFFQVFDKGTLEDGEGREIDFKNTVILLTSNVGTDTITRLCADPNTLPNPLALAEALRSDLLHVFPPAFLGRLNVVPYYPLGDQVMRSIITLQLDRVATRLRENHSAKLVYNDELVDHIATRCREAESGARNIDAIITRSLLPDISNELLTRMARGEQVNRVEVAVNKRGAFEYMVFPRVEENTVRRQ